MNRKQFKKLYRTVRETQVARRIEHDGRNWTVSRGDVQRLDSFGCFDRVGRHAMTLDSAADCRKRLGLKASTRVLVLMAREYRESAA